MQSRQNNNTVLHTTLPMHRHNTGTALQATPLQMQSRHNKAAVLQVTPLYLLRQTRDTVLQPTPLQMQSRQSKGTALQATPLQMHRQHVDTVLKRDALAHKSYRHGLACYTAVEALVQAAHAAHASHLVPTVTTSRIPGSRLTHNLSCLRLQTADDKPAPGRLASQRGFVSTGALLVMASCMCGKTEPCKCAHHRC